MSEALSNEVLRRMARAGREEQQARVMSPARAMRLALSRAADDLFDLAITVRGVQSEQAGQESMLRMIDDEMLLIVLDGPRGAVGAVAVDLDVLAGLIEKQTMGRVLEQPAAPRAPTATDAALIAPLVDRLLEGVANNLGGVDGKICAGFKFGARLDSKRHLSLLVEAADFHVLRAQTELEGGAKRGEFVLIVPALVEPVKPALSVEEHTESERAECKKNTFAQSALMLAEAPMQAVIHRQKMSLGEIARLAVGDVLSLPEDVLGKLTLGQGDGQRLGPCKLGQAGGFRAVQLCFAVREEDRARLILDEGEHVLSPPEHEISVPMNDAAEFEKPEVENPPQQQGKLAQEAPPDLSDLPEFEEDHLAQAG